MKHISLFSGIGGFDLAAEWMGWENVAHCEWNPFGQRVLKYYWPNAISYDDITKTDFTIHRGHIDILTGGFPCQPYSVAGKRKGKEDERHLWPEMLRAIREVTPRWVVGENVRGLVNWNGGLVFDEVQADLEAEGYEVWPFLLPAVGVGANHVRERIWFVAYSTSLRWKSLQSIIEPSTEASYDSKRDDKKESWQEANELGASCNSFLRFTEMYGQPPVFSVDDGLPFRLDGITVPKWIEGTMMAVGNAVNPKVVHQIFKAIEQFESLAS